MCHECVCRPFEGLLCPPNGSGAGTIFPPGPTGWRPLSLRLAVFPRVVIPDDGVMNALAAPRCPHPPELLGVFGENGTVV